MISAALRITAEEPKRILTKACTNGIGLIHHLLGSDLTGLHQRFGIAGDLTANQGLHTCHEVLAKDLDWTTGPFTIPSASISRPGNRV